MAAGDFRFAEEGRLLKLLSGLMMLGLGAFLLLAPERPGNAAAALSIPCWLRL